jgi:hypothetical protein
LLYISSGPLQDVMKQVQAAKINLREAYEAGRAHVLRFALSETLQQQGDDGLARALQDLAAMIEQHRPERVVINDFAPFVAFASTKRLREAFEAMQATIAPLRATVLLVLSEQAPGIVDVLQELVMGDIQVALPDPAAGDLQLTLTPGVTPNDQVSDAEQEDHTDRYAFGLRLQQHFHRHAVNETPFTLIAIRNDTDAGRALRFSDFYTATEPLLHETEYDWFINLDAERLIVLIPQSQPDDAHRLFARLKQRLLRTFPAHGADYLHAFSAIVVANGGDFQNAEDFLSVALEENATG